MIQTLLTKVFGSRNQRLLKGYRKVVERINQLESQFEPLSDAELAGKTDEFRRRLADGRLSQNGSYSGQASLLLEDNSEYELKGVVQFREVSVDPTTGSFILRLVFANPKNDLLPGMFVRAIIDEGANNNAILVPQQCVSRNASGDALVMTVGADNTVEAKMIHIDRAIGNKWLVSEGLKVGDRVIREGLLRARPGTVVNPVPDGQAPAATTAPAAPAATDSAPAADTMPAADSATTTPANADSPTTTK